MASDSSVRGSLDHMCDVIEQLIFTSAGERMNRPDFGGVNQLLFAPTTPAVQAVALDDVPMIV